MRDGFEVFAPIFLFFVLPMIVIGSIVNSCEREKSIEEKYEKLQEKYLDLILEKNK